MTTVEELFNRIDSAVIVDENGKEKPIGLNQEQEDVIKYLIRGFFIELFEELRLEKHPLNYKKLTEDIENKENENWLKGFYMGMGTMKNMFNQELNNKIDKLQEGEKGNES